MESSFSRQRKPLYGEGIARLTNRVAVDVKAKYRLISRTFLDVFHTSVRLTNQKPRAFVSIR